MFEVVLTLCLIGSKDICRDVLLPGREAQSIGACNAHLATAPSPEWPDGLEPSGAPFCQPAGPGLPITEIADGIYVHEGAVAEPAASNLGAVSNFGFVVGDNSIAVIDTGGSRSVGEDLYRAIRHRNSLPISHVILTHMHPDHVFGASVFGNPNTIMLGHARLERALADRSASYLTAFSRLMGEEGFIGTETVPPNETVSTKQVIDLGNRELEITAWPTSHTGTDITVLDKTTGILFTGDLIFQRHTPALDGSLPGWQSVLKSLEDTPLDGIVPGHGPASLPWPEGSEDLKRYLNVLAADTRAAINRGDSLSSAVKTIARSEAPNWELFDLYNPRNATVAYTELEWE